METIQNIQKISLWFFIVLGTAYILTSLMDLNDYFNGFPLIIHRTIQIPFILCALIYGISSVMLSIANPDKKNRILFVIAGIVCAAIVIAIIILEMFFPDAALKI